MALDVWKGGCFFLLVVVFTQFYLIISSDRKPSGLTGLPVFGPTNEPGLRGWEFNTTRDSENTGLTLAQCDAAFPDLYYEIDRAVAVWQKRKHTITPKDIGIDWRNDGAMQVRCLDQQKLPCALVPFRTQEQIHHFIAFHLSHDHDS